MNEKSGKIPDCPRCEELAEAAKFSKQAEILTKTAQSCAHQKAQNEQNQQDTDNSSPKPLDSAYLQNLLASLPPAHGELASETEYLARIKACQNCPDIRTNVLCSWCGCYVALRARPKNANCPHPSGNKWQFS